MSALFVTPVGPVENDLLFELCGSISILPGLDLRQCRLEVGDIQEYAYDSKRCQYSSTLILRRLLLLVPDEGIRLLAVTELDLFIPMLTFVFGQAQLDGRAAIISLARLRQEFYSLPPNRTLLINRAAKEAMHELGHTFGVTHCELSDCPMSLSTTLQQVDSKGLTYCGNCGNAVSIALRQSATAHFKLKTGTLTSLEK